MTDPTFEKLATSIEAGFAELRVPYRQWADLARLAIQGAPYDARSRAALEHFINAKRAQLRKEVLIASEHLTEEQLEHLRERARMSKYAWNSLKSTRPVNIKSGFTLVSY